MLEGSRISNPIQEDWKEILERGCMMHGHMREFLKGLDFTMENKGEQLVITIKGDKEKIKNIEKKLNALKELCDGECECSCC